MIYKDFIHQKSQLDGDFGFEPNYLPSTLFDFQAHVTEWAVRKGRAAIFADCGMGKTLMQLVWAQNVVNKTGKPVIILTPLAVSSQFASEAERFGIDAARSRKGEIPAPIVITNYERLHLFDSSRFGGLVCDESSILKSFDGVYKAQITEFMRLMKYRLLGTATAAPNDFTEVGTSSEALGYLGYMDMLGRFFTNKENTSHSIKGRWRASAGDEWRFKGHAEEKFWRWMTSWARALRKPSDVGFDDGRFELPPLVINNHTVENTKPANGMLFSLPAIGLDEQREERRRTIGERCEMAASLVNGTGESAVLWCSLNDEGDLLEKLIPDSQQVAGKHNDDQKEERFDNFATGKTRVLITKPKIGAWGLNWQHCNHIAYFPSHSYEQYYQAIRRCWRFGQERPVTVDIVSTIGEQEVLKNLQGKAAQADKMFTKLVEHMNNSVSVQRKHEYNKQMELPKWLS